MKRRLFIIVPMLALLLALLTGCGCEHQWSAATCTEAKTCSLCNESEGAPLGHTWQDATCTEAKTCSVCGATDGEALGHDWQDATCTAPKTCAACALTEGDLLPHDWQEATTEAPKTCSACQATEGSKLITDSRFTTPATKHLHGTWVCNQVVTDKMSGLDGFGDTDVHVTLTFGKTGQLQQRVAVVDAKDYLTRLKKYTVDTMYRSFTDKGFSKSQADEAMIQTYGKNVKDYVDAIYKDYDVQAEFSAQDCDIVYYVEGDALYIAADWKSKFTKIAYTLQDGKLLSKDLVADENGKAVPFVKQ